MRVLQAKAKRPLDVLAVGAGGHVAAASSAFEATGRVEVWDVATGKVVFTHAGGRGNRQSLAFTPDGRHLFVGGDEVLEVFEIGAWQSKSQLDFDCQNPEVAVDPQGRRLIATGLTGTRGRIACWDLRAGQKLIGKKLWDDRTFDVLVGEPSISPDGARWATSVHDNQGNRTRNTVRVGDPASGKVLSEIDFDPTGADPIQQIAFSADGEKVLVRASGRVVKLFDAATGQPAGELVHPGRPYVTGVAVHPNGTVACSRNNGAVCFWDLAKHKLVRTLDWELGKLVSVAFAPDGSIGAAGTEDGQVVVWDVDG